MGEKAVSEQLLVGAGRATIRFPAELFPLEGFRGVHDDPAARIMVLDCGERAALACLELVMLDDGAVRALRERIGALTGTKPENVWLHTTHVITTPHAPHAPVGMGGVPIALEEAEREKLARKSALFSAAVTAAVEQAAAQAAADLRPARMGVGAGECHVNKSRDVETPFGWWIGSAPEGFSNHTATVLRFDREDGSLAALLISYGLKPCAIDNSEMEKNTRLVSGDVPGTACRLLEERFGAPCLFAMSAAGDQVPAEQAWYDVVEADGTVRTVDLGVETGLAMAKRLGEQMARELVPVVERVTCGQHAPAIRLAQGSLVWSGKARGGMKPTRQANYKPAGTVQVDTLALLIGDVAFAGLKPEINAVTEAQLQAQSPFDHTLVISMVNGGQKYMPDRTSYERVTWEAQSAPLMPGAAEAWVGETVELLKRLYGEKKGEKQ